MKFTKKLFAVALALCLMLCLSIPAFAETTYKDTSTVEITKVYESNGAGESPEETFKLVETDFVGVEQNDIVFADLSDADKAKIDLPGKNVDGVGKVISEVKFDKGDAGKADKKSKKFTFNLPDYDKVGVYTYKLKEVPGDTAGVEYCNDDITLVVTVVNNGKPDGKLARLVAVHVGSHKTSSFTNTYSAGTLKVAKVVTGNMGDKQKKFDFTVTFTKLDSVNVKSNITATVAGGTATNLNLVWTENKATYNFSLADGETASFDNLPYGVQYEVNEATYSDYTPTTDKAKGTINADTLDAEKHEVTATITNDKNNNNIDMGVTLDNLPYILVLVAVLGGAVVMFTRKRRFED